VRPASLTLRLIRDARIALAGALLACGVGSAPGRAQTARQPGRVLMLYGLPPDKPTESVWERSGGAILVSLGLITGQSVLIALLLLERQRRIRAQLAVADQAAYEQTKRMYPDLLAS